MSLVGTRPPTVDEWDKYELHHRARLATKPGLTGMWQVSGRSNITDLTSFLTENVGVDAYGYVSIAKTFVSYAGIITIALTAFIVRYITISYNEGNIKEG